MSLPIRLLLSALLCSLALAEIRTLQTLDPGFDAACHQLIDLNGDGRDELLLIGRDGEIRTWLHDPEGGMLQPAPRGEQFLLHPSQTVLTLADLEQTGGPPQLVAVTPKGLFLYRPDADGVFSEAPVRLIRRARFSLRTGRPVLAPIAPDVNNDGQPDLVIPGQDQVELWMARGEEGWRKTAAVDVRMSESRHTRMTALSDELASLFSIPQLRTRDVNGDGRPDLLVEDGNLRAFHMQAEDGSFPAQADVRLDLNIFKDTSPESSIRPGRTLAGGDRTTYQSRDLDGDGIPDYVLAHRRKVWVFHGGAAGPQFTEPSTILKVADDVTAMLLVKLDDDAFPELVLLKVQVPTVATLILGLLSSWDVEVTALGYRNDGGRAYDTSAAWKSEITVRLPAITDILRDASSLIERLRDIDSAFQQVAAGDFDADGSVDLALWERPNEIGQDQAFSIWYDTGSSSESEEGLKETEFRRLLFEEEDRIWNLDRILSWMESLAKQRASVLTGDREADATVELRGAPFLLESLEPADFNGDGQAELVAVYRELGDRPRCLVDLLGER